MSYTSNLTGRPWLATAELAALDAAMAAKCSPADLHLNRRFIFAGQADTATAAMRYTECLRSIKRANRRKGRAIARHMAKQRDNLNQWLNTLGAAQNPAEPVYEAVTY